MDDFALAENNPFIELFSFTEQVRSTAYGRLDYWSVWVTATISYYLITFESFDIN